MTTENSNTTEYKQAWKTLMNSLSEKELAAISGALKEIRSGNTDTKTMTNRFKDAFSEGSLVSILDFLALNTPESSENNGSEIGKEVSNA